MVRWLFVSIAAVTCLACGGEVAPGAAAFDGGAPLGAEGSDASGTVVADSASSPTVDAGLDADSATSCTEPALPIRMFNGRPINVVIDGDSRVLGAYLDGGAPWPQLAALLAGPEIHLTNVAQVDATTATMMQRAPVSVDGLYNANATRNVVVVMIGLSDLRVLTSRTQLAPAEANLTAYGQDRLAKGWELYVVPDLPAGIEVPDVWLGWVAFERTGAFATGVIEIGLPYDDFASGISTSWTVDGALPSQAGCVRIADRVGRFLGAL